MAGAGNRARPLEILRDLGFESTEVDDPYAAMTELCRRPLVYRAVILSLASLYREELAIIPAIKSRFPHVELWLAHTDGRQAALADSMRLGADGLLADDGLHRIAAGAGVSATAQVAAPTTGAVNATVTAPVWRDADPAAPVVPQADGDDRPPENPGDAPPILTADELRALLHEQSPVPPHDD